MDNLERTAVTVSIHRTNDSEVRYLESEKEYSFHNCPNRSCLPGMLAWLKAKYPVLSSALARVRWFNVLTLEEKMYCPS